MVRSHLATIYYSSLVLATVLVTTVATSAVYAADDTTGAANGNPEVNTVTSKVEPLPEKKFGVYASLGNPFPTVFGLNAAYNATPHLRAMIGYGEVSLTSSITITDSAITTEKVTAKTYAAGAEYLFLDSVIRPAAGLHAGYFDVSGKGDISLNGFKSSSGYAYANLGADYVNAKGYQVGAGVNLTFLGTSSAGIYVDSGWFF